MVQEKDISLQTKNVVTVLKSIKAGFAEFINFCSFFKGQIANKMDRHSYNAYFVSSLTRLWKNAIL